MIFRLFILTFLLQRNKFYQNDTHNYSMLYPVTTNSNKIREPTLLQGLRYKLMIEYKDTLGRTRRYYIVTGQCLNEEVF